MSSRPGPAAGAARPAGFLDLRLLPAALAIWAATALALQVRPVVAAGVGLVAVVATVGLLTCGRSARGRGWLSVVAVALAFTAAGALGTAARVAARDASPVAQAASGPTAARTTVTLELEITDDPRPIADGFGGQSRVLVPARATALSIGGVRQPDDTAVVVLADAVGWGDLLPSQRVRADGRLLPPRGGDLTGAAFAARGPPDRLGGPSWLQRAAGALRAGLVRAAAVLPERPRGLLPGLVLGDTSGMDPILVEEFRATGLTHLVAVSGANCAIVVGAVVWLLRRVGVPRVLLAVLAGVALAGFVVLVRPSPSVLRAAAMGAIALLALASGRPRSALSALSAAIVVLMLVVPGLAWSPGFALSVAATAGIVLMAPYLLEWLRRRRVPAGLAAALAVSIAASTATAPLIAALSSTVSLVSIPANLLAAPAVPVATVLGVLATLVSPLSGSVASGLAWLAGVPTAWLVLIAEYGSGLPAATHTWPGGAAGGGLLAAALLACALGAQRWPAVGRVLLAAALSGLLVVVPVRVLGPGWPPDGWLFVACDVGQGDALVVRAEAGQAVVVDAGPDPAAVDRCLRDLGIDSIPLLVLTHLHADHVAGLSGALADRRVGTLEVGPQPDVGLAYDEVLELARSAGATVATGRVGEVRRVGGVEVTVLAPVTAAHGSRSDPNNSSLVLRVSTGGIGLLLTGDIEVEGQDALLDSGADLRAEVLKVPHHGSAYQDDAFLAAVDARVAVISVGADNDYGHPSSALVDELRALGTQVWRTDTDGALAIGRSDGGLLWVSPRSRAPPAAADRGPSAGGSDGGPCHDDGMVTPASGPDLPPAVTLVHGDEELLRHRAIAAVVSAARSAEPDCDVREVAASQLAVGDLFDLLSPSLFASARVLVVTDAQETTKEVATQLLAYAREPLPEIGLVVAHHGGARNKALVDGLRAAGAQVVICAKVTRNEDRLAFLRSEVRGHGGSIDPAAAAALLDAVGNDLRELAATCGQLVSDTGGRVDAAAVARYHRGRAEVSGFSVADRAVVGDRAGALEALRWALSVGVPHVVVADALADGVRSVGQVASAPRVSTAELARALGMPPWKLERARRQARGWSERGLRRALAVVADLNAEVKGTVAEPSYALERAIRLLVEARAEAAGPR